VLLFRLGQKFGADPSLTKGLLETAKALELQVVGVSFHVGSGQAGRRLWLILNLGDQHDYFLGQPRRA
jgi:diaminopimelate decarboxylase